MVVHAKSRAYQSSLGDPSDNLALYLVPLAIEKLSANPLVAGDFYPGDLLQSVLRIDPSFWVEHPEWRRQVAAILQEIVHLSNELPSAAALTSAASVFLQHSQQRNDKVHPGPVQGSRFHDRSSPGR
jgi:hypothetical protein